MSASRSRYCVMKCKYDVDEFDKISFHSFPRDEQKRQLWIEATNKKNWSPPKSARLCSLHFESRYIDKFDGKATLRNLAIPTIFEHGNERLVRSVRRKHYSEIVKPLEPQERFRHSSNIPITKEVSSSSSVSPRPSNVTPSIKSANLVDVDKKSSNTIPNLACVSPIPTIFDNYDQHHLGKLKYTTEIEILDDVDFKSENKCSPSYVGADDILQYNEEKMYAAPIDTIDEELVEIPNYHESTSTIHTDVESCCRLCLRELTDFDIQYLTVLKFDEIPINFTELNISIDDGLPQRICENCSQDLEVIKCFIQQARRAQKILRKYLRTRIEIQIDPVDNITEELSNELKDILDNETNCVTNETEPNPINSQDFLEVIRPKSVDISDTETVDNSQTKVTVNPDRCCEICDKTFSKKVYKTKHMEIHMNNTFDCEICGSSHKRRMYLNRHIRRNHSTMIRTCPKCNATFTKPDRYKYHLKTHNPNKKYKCQYCEKSFLQPHHLRNHELSHTGVKPYLCFICGESFREEQRYKCHINKHKNGTLDKVRHRSTRLEQAMKDVKVTYRYGKPINSLPTYNCHICCKSFRLPSSLENHLDRHKEERRHKCTMCSLRYKRLAHLQSHIRFVHMKKRPFKCTVCGRQFAHNCGLAEHMTSHSDERPFQCDLCPLNYRTKRSLKLHLRSHTGETSVQCIYCDESFATHALLIVHNFKHADVKIVPENT